MPRGEIHFTLSRRLDLEHAERRQTRAYRGSPLDEVPSSQAAPLELVDDLGLIHFLPPFPSVDYDSQLAHRLPMKKNVT